MVNKPLLSVKEASEYLGVSPTTIYRLKKDGKIPYIQKLGIGIRLKLEDLDKWLEESSYKPLKLIPDLLRNNSILNNLLACDISEPGGESELPKGKSKTHYNFGYGAIYIRKTKSGHSRFYLDYYDAEGKRRQVLDRNALSWEMATAALKDIVLKEHAKKFGYGQRKIKVGFREFAQVYLEDYIKVERRNWRSDNYRLEILKEYFKDKELREITPLMIQRFRDSRLKAGNTKSTTNRYLALLKRMFNLAIEEGYLEGNVVKKVKLYSEWDTVKERILTEGEERRLMEVASDRLRSILTIALNIGLRLGEILNLQWRHIDFTARKVSVEKTKNGKVRFIPLNDVLLKELVALKHRDNQNPFLFFNLRTRKPLTRVERAFKTACRKADIKGLRFHDLRHTFATRLIERGIDVITVQNLLGHSSVIITQRYTHSGDERKRKAVELLGKLGEKRDGFCDRFVTRKEQFNLIN